MKPAPEVVVAHSPGPEATRRLGAALASVVEAGDIVLLEGEMGAGKTVFATGVGAGLGVPSPVTSPTFVLVRSQQGRSLTLHHADLWRLGSGDEIADLGLAELAEDGGVALVEWGERARELVGGEYLGVVIEPEGPERRLVRFEARGPRWERRMGALSAAIAQGAGGSQG